MEGSDLYRVLLVDDDKSILCGLRQFENWESCGFIVEEEAYDGIGALEKLTKKNFDLVITDIRMPGMDGLRLLSEVKKRKLNSCLMLMSTYDDFEYAQEGLRLGISDYIMKPVDDIVLEESLGQIKKYLDKQKLQKAILDENNLELYYPKSQERRIIDLIMAGKYEAMNEALTTFLDSLYLLDQDICKVAILLRNLLLNVSKELYCAFPALESIEELKIDDFSNSDSVNEIKFCFLECIKSMLNIISKYELHHADSLVKKTCLYVINHVEEDITLENIAEEVQFSKNYIGKLFKEKTGTNFIDYVTKVKMEYAKHLLKTGNLRNYEISDKLGYCTPDYFYRLFKGYTGYTPVEFKKMII